MIPRTPAVNYLVAQLLVRLRGEVPGNAKLPPPPSKIERQELRAAISIVLDELRAEFSDLGSRATSDLALGKQLDILIDEALTRVEVASDRF
jgi:hypothetical protein